MNNMPFVISKVADSVFGIALWDSSWNSYNNCYVINREGKTLLLDCGKREQSNQLVEALREINVHPDDVDVFIATHGHIDHIGATATFRRAAKWIHADDWDRLSEEQTSEFNKLDSDIGVMYGLSFLRVGHHTNGSIAIYDVNTRCLFCGDYICFFGAKLVDNSLVTFGNDLRKKYHAFVMAWSQSPENRNKYHYESFACGLKVISSFKEAIFLATGHGPILHNNIIDFINELISINN
ncbi:MBL fold metallo-hydrolase [Sulfobacillus thermosulfidooxidans]|uniref:MBL fold metallo-hydrolase n=1 Tax=Sulfobacillus thermosulfidooxidans TaxID=28034 RepID=UPI0006B47B10|nr:MBL fold metallo-hydrolase [Sulfobacillus thermosulfidooxidans]